MKQQEMNTFKFIWRIKVSNTNGKDPKAFKDESCVCLAWCLIWVWRWLGLWSNRKWILSNRYHEYSNLIQKGRIQKLIETSVVLLMLVSYLCMEMVETLKQPDMNIFNLLSQRIMYNANVKSWLRLISLVSILSIDMVETMKQLKKNILRTNVVQYICSNSIVK